MQKFTTFLAASLLSLGVNAGTIDFTDSSLAISGNSFSGSVDGIGYKITSAPGNFDYSENVSGDACGSSSLVCEKDGIGISSDSEFNSDNDEIDVTEVFTLTFDKVVKVSGFYFLDLFEGEYATVLFDDFELKDFYGTEPLPGYGFLEATLDTAIYATELKFSAMPFAVTDQGDNNFALAGVEVSAVPVPAAAFLFAPALIGFMSLRRKAAKNS